MTTQTIKKAAPRVVVLAFVGMSMLGGVGNSQQTPQYPLMEMIANKVIAKYQGMSCQQLQQSKKTPPSGQEAEMMAKAVTQLKQDPAMRQAFINKVAPPIANKMFDCGLIP